MKTTTRKQAIDLTGLECYELNSRILPCVYVGTYESMLSPDLVAERAMENEKYDNPLRDFIYEDDFDMRAYRGIMFEHVSELIQDEVLTKLDYYGVAAMVPTGIYSPQEYNLSNDTLEFKVYMKKGWRDTMRRELDRMRSNASLGKYIKEHWHSCSGFISWMPKSIDEILDFDDRERCLAAYLTLCLLVEGHIRPNDDYETMESELHELMYHDERTEECCELRTYGSGYYRSTSSFGKEESEELLLMYADKADELSDLSWDLFHKIGHKWRGWEPRECNACYIRITNDLMRFVIWAIDNRYSLSDLRNLAA